MIEVLPVQSKSEQEALCARCKIKYKPDYMSYCVISPDGSAAAVSQFKIGNGHGIVEDLVLMPGIEDSFEILFLLGRATLNFIELCGIDKAFYTGPDFDDTILRAIGFSKNSDGMYCVNLTELFKSPCAKAKNNTDKTK